MPTSPGGVFSLHPEDEAEAIKSCSPIGGYMTIETGVPQAPDFPRGA